MVNWDRVAELRTEIGDDDLAEVVSLFLEESDEVAARLGERLASARRGDDRGSVLAADLHFLKGSALNLGFTALAVQCQDGESLSGKGLDGQVDLAGILALYTATKAVFQAGQPAQD